MGRHKKYNEYDAIEKGVLLFRRRGYHHTSAADIVKTLDIPKGTFFGMFQTKEAYALKVLERYVDDTVHFMDKLFRESETLNPRARLKSFYQNLTIFYTQEGCTNGCLLYNLMSEIAGYNDAFSTLVRKGHTKFIEKIEPCIREGQEKKLFRSDIDSIELTDFIHTSFNGAVIKMKGQRDNAPLRLFLRTVFKTIIT